MTSEPLNRTEKIINADGSPTQYFIRYLGALSAAGQKSVTVTGQVTSVNGMTGDVVIEIPDTGSDFIFNIGVAIMAEVSALIDAKIKTHNDDPLSHSFLSAEKSIFYAQNVTRQGVGYAVVTPHLYDKGFNSVPIALSRGAGSGGYNSTTTAPVGFQMLNWAALSSGDVSPNRNVYIGAFYVPSKSARCRGVVVPVKGGQSTGTFFGNSHDDMIRWKASIFTSKPQNIAGGMPIKGVFKGAAGAACNLTRFNGSKLKSLVFPSLSAWNNCDPEVGDIIQAQATNVEGNRINPNFILTADVGTLTVTFNQQDNYAGVTSTYAQDGVCVYSADTAGFSSARWLDRMIWSSRDFTDYTAEQEDGWIYANAGNSTVAIENAVQSQVFGAGEAGASIKCDFEMTEGIHFIVLVENAVGTPNNNDGVIGVANPIYLVTSDTTLIGDRRETSAGGTVAYKTTAFARGLMSKHTISPFFADGYGSAVSIIPGGGIVNDNATGTGGVFATQHANFFACSTISDADTVAALDDFQITEVFPDIPYTADQRLLSNFTPAVGDGFVATDKGYIANMTLAPTFLLKFVE
ncbi:MAG TPA: hypothetical protein VEC93_08930 [Anaerolineae bacterium]|nr:hypothetical protein [Anaerolineae bacterium]